MRSPIFHRTTDYDRSLLPNRHLATLEEGVSGPEDWVERSGHSVGYPAWGLIYYLTLCAVTYNRRNDIIETGTNQGASTIVLAQALADAGVEGIVSAGRCHRARSASLATAPWRRRRTSSTRSSRRRLPEVVFGLGVVSRIDLDLAFLDGSHLEDDVLTEFELVYPRLSDTAIVVFDNTLRIAEDDEDGRVNGALRSILDRWGGHLVNLPFCSWYTPGLAVWQRRPLETMEPSARRGAP